MHDIAKIENGGLVSLLHGKGGELTIPKVPQGAGSYELSIFIEGMALAKLPFTIQ